MWGILIFYYRLRGNTWMSRWAHGHFKFTFRDLKTRLKRGRCDLQLAFNPACSAAGWISQSILSKKCLWAAKKAVTDLHVFTYWKTTTAERHPKHAATVNQIIVQFSSHFSFLTQLLSVLFIWGVYLFLLLPAFMQYCPLRNIFVINVWQTEI